MVRLSVSFGVCALVGSTIVAGPASAETRTIYATDAQIVRPASAAVVESPLHTAGRTRVRVVTREVVDAGLVIDPAVSRQPTRADLIEVRVVNTTVYLDPNQNYLRQGSFRIDHNHHLLKSQRLYRSLSAEPARIIRGGQFVAGRAEAPVIVPRAVIQKPQAVPAPQKVDEPGSPERTPPIPAVPVSPPAENPRLTVGDLEPLHGTGDGV